MWHGDLRDSGFDIRHLVDEAQLHADVAADRFLPNFRRFDREPGVQFAGLGQGLSVEHVGFVHEELNAAFECVPELITERTWLPDIEVLHHPVIPGEPLTG